MTVYLGMVQLRNLSTAELNSLGYVSLCINNLNASRDVYLY